MTHDMGLPDPVRDSGYYAGVPLRRLFAFAVDLLGISAMVLIVFLIAMILFIPTLGLSGVAFTGFFMGSSLIYRLGTVMTWGATPGMALAGIEIAGPTGEVADAGVGFVHTIGYHVCFFFPPLLLLSLAMMALTPRGQGLHDIVIGAAVINRPE